jgi:long-chain acyl-CoA synthetase
MQVNPHGNCLGWRSGTSRYKWLSYTQVHEKVVSFGSALVRRGAARGSLVAIYAVNCPEWVVASRACNAQSLVSCPLYDTLGVDACKFILCQTEAAIVVVGAKQYPLLMDIADQCPALRVIVRIGPKDDKIVDPRVVAFEDMLEEGAKNPLPPNPPSPEDVATVCYTSGTTGDPKVREFALVPCFVFQNIH